ncbi:PTS system, fructose subfamily, IIC subunit [Thermoanaerobacterium thermosaccharolyticum DSM 571]|uniref:PTS system, fructose subfamily, IIC subunit n=1 Tax=Thermoanaerobacterium thermosaccharolyticum (strain ATCC 7956 / DSM 571 / NCIMB 9385 / NCA 3814 / NCTC 13789 / WDCM 00135 / 2032) TaxID=580327 RepID=D9TLR9_THETC|nr:fructose-specific PTS transporter subunit EIIC [Thermoanaerobacterium thermosaccharolyticum]ADL70005.1 PTS system, fructose subfamily, IIC subunit [Thermoanaerobacterium thermosaccharolyticum DSM 571]
MKKIVAVTACPTGIAHTYMAAENLEMAGKELNVAIKVETQGSIGAENQLTENDIREADAVIIAAATKVDKSRFEGKPILEVPVEEAIKNPKDLIERALKMEKPKDYIDKVEKIHEERASQRTGVYKHLMTGVSYMIPFVVAGGISIALSFLWGYKAFQVQGTLPAALMQIGSGAAFALMVPILSGFLAYSIADRPGLVPGMVGGMLAVSTGAGFLGGIISGFLAGYTVYYLKKTIKLPKTMEGLMPVLILPVLSTLIVGLLMIYVVGTPMKTIMTGLTNWLKGMGSTNAVIFGALLGLMMAFDMGGPVNKTVYTFATGLLASNVFMPMAAVMAAGMTPPLGLALATVLFRNRFTQEEREAGKAAWVLGASFITEGAIPFAAADPFRVIPSIMVGSAVTGALLMLFHIELRAPHGGIFVIPIAISNPLLYIVAILIGMVVTALMIGLLKKKIS